MKELLYETYGPTLTVAELAQVLKRTEKTLRNDISARRCPIPTFKLMGRRVASVETVAEYITACEQDQRL